jgi:hypothetical protein
MGVSMDASALPSRGSCLPFLAVRRGLPLAGFALCCALALLEPAGRGWYVMGAVALCAEVWPTFKRGPAYLQHRTTILRWDTLWVRTFRPLARLLGREEAWLLSYFNWNNLRIHEAFSVRKARRPLVLLPHCIQMARCKAEILTDLQHCFECGQCPVGDLLPSLLERRWNTRITNRSHKAYQEARTWGPDLIVAVSCLDRLLKGLSRLPEIPSYVIPLELPHGMCVDTQFSVPRLVAAMEELAEPSSPRIQPLVREGIA